MRKLLVLGASLAFLSVMAYAETWSGTLVDATCAMQNQQGQQNQQNQQGEPQQQGSMGSQQQGAMGSQDQGATGSQDQGNTGYQQQGSSAACEPTSTTTAFALRTSSGQTYQLDDAGNAKVITAMRDRADRMRNEGTSSANQSNMPVHATVKGSLNNNFIKVDSVQVR